MSHRKYNNGSQKQDTTSFREVQEYNFPTNGNSAENGVVDFKIIIEETYNGRDVSSVDEWFEDRGLIFPYGSSYINVEEREGKLLSSAVEHQTLSGGIRFDLEFTSSLRVGYDGKQIDEITQSTWDIGGQTTDTTTRYDYNKRGLITERITETDHWISGDERGNIDYRTTETFTYTNKKLLTSFEVRNERLIDNELVIDPFNAETKTTYQYNERGDVTLEQRQHNFNNEGFVTVYTRSLLYDAKGNVINTVEENFGITIRTQFEYDRKGNLLVEDRSRVGDYRIINEYEYDKKGNVVTHVYKSNGSGGEEIEEQIVRNYEYDRKGNVLTENITRAALDYNEQGEWGLTVYEESTINYEYFFNRKGEILKRTAEYDNFNDNVIDRVDTFMFEYDRKGEMISRIYEEDFKADGMLEFRSVAERLEIDSSTAEVEPAYDQLIV
jgi:hypothetical protein